MLIKWPRGGDRDHKYEVYKFLGIRIEVWRTRNHRIQFSDQIGMPFTFSMHCSHNHFARRDLSIHFRHVAINIYAWEAKKHNEVGGTGFWSWPKRTLKNKLHFLFDRCWRNAKNQFGKDMAREGMNLTRKW